MDSAKDKNKNYIKVTQHKSIYMVKKRNKSKMCNGNKKCKTIRCAQNSTWDLINSDMNMNREGCADGLFRVCTQKNTGDENMYVSSNNLETKLNQ